MSSENRKVESSTGYMMKPSLAELIRKDEEEKEEIKIAPPFTPHPEQAGFITSTSKFICVFAGRRGGKSTGLGIRAVRCFMVNKARVEILAPETDQTDAAWSVILYMLREPIERGILKVWHSYRIIAANARTDEWRIRCRTAKNPDSVRGGHADELILDEFQLMNPDMIEKVALPMLMDTNGTLTLVFTPPDPMASAREKLRSAESVRETYKNAVESKEWEIYKFTAFDNPGISEEAIERMRRNMSDEAFRAEVLAEFVDSSPHALWRKEWIRYKMPSVIHDLSLVVDPSGSGSGDECGIVFVGVNENDNGIYVLDDQTIRAAPAIWASHTVEQFYKYPVQRVIVERSFGDMAATVLMQQDPLLPIIQVTPVRSKRERAEPVSVMYRNGEVFHARRFERLESQMLLWYPGAGKSPDRLDAMVHGVLFYKFGMESNVGL